MKLIDILQVLRLDPNSMLDDLIECRVDTHISGMYITPDNTTHAFSGYLNNVLLDLRELGSENDQWIMMMFSQLTISQRIDKCSDRHHVLTFSEKVAGGQMIRSELLMLVNES